MPAYWRCLDGSAHPVSDEFAARVPNHLQALSFAELETERQRLLTISGADKLAGGRPLADDERSRLEAVTHVINLNRALAWLAGRDYREIFGDDATLDQVHGNSLTADCGCVVQHMFDHSRRHEAGNPVHPHHSLKHCAGHAHMKGDFRAHHAAVASRGTPRAPC